MKMMKEIRVTAEPIVRGLHVVACSECELFMSVDWSIAQIDAYLLSHITSHRAVDVKAV